MLGLPDEDSGWVEYLDHQPGLGYCGGEEWRVVRWGQLGVVFTDEVDTDYAPEGARHFDTYDYGWWSDVATDEYPLRTSAGLALDDTRDEALELYGESATFNAGDEIVEPYVTIDLGDVYPILAILDGDTSTVIAIAGGSSCGE